MKQIIFSLMVMTYMITGCKQPAADNAEAGADTTAADTSKPTEAPPMDSAAMMKAWQAFMTPGDMHAWMAKGAGTWDVAVKSWMDPAAPPLESKATNVVTMDLNGLYQMAHYSGNMMGMPFEGKGVMGYDNAKKMFVNTWVDNFGSGIMMMTGTLDEASKTLTLNGTQTDPVTGKDSGVRQEWKFIDDNNQLLTMYGAGMDGKEMKFMEAMMVRKV